MPKEKKEDEGRIAQDFNEFYKEHSPQDVEVAPGVSYNYLDVLTENRRMFHSRFENETTASGLTKIYYNIAYTYYDTQYRHTDIDFKDVDLVARNQMGLKVAPIFRKVLQSYVSKANFKGDKPDKVINEIRASLLQDGVCYLKLVGDTPYVVDPFNIIEPANQDGLGTMAEKIRLRPDQVREMYGTVGDVEDPEGTQLKLDELIDGAEIDGKQILIYEYWVMAEKPFCQIWIGEEDEDVQLFTKTDDWKVGFQIDEFDSPYKDQWDNVTMPYAKQHHIQVKGRRGGFSIFEIVKGVMYHYNEVENMNREKSLIDLRGLFVFKKGFRSKNVPQGFLNKIGLGGFLEVERDEEISRLPYQYVANEVIGITNNLFDTGRRLTGTTSMDVGEDLPSRVSATAVVDSRKNSQSSYDVTIENMSILLTDFLERVWAPVIFKNLVTEDAIAIVGSFDEIDRLDKLVVERGLYSEMQEVKKKYNFYGVLGAAGNPVPITNQAEIDIVIEQRMEALKEQGLTRSIDVSKELLDALKYSITFVVGSERINKEAKLQNFLMWRQNTQNPFTAEKLDMLIADLVGEDPAMFKMTDAQMQQAIQMTQGGQQQDPRGQQNVAGQPVQVEQNSPNTQA